MSTQLEIANRALAIAGTRSQLAAIDTTTQEGIYIGLLYAPLRDMMLREGDYDFAMKRVTPATTTLVSPWAYAYSYPSGCLRVRQAIPSAVVALDPTPVEWNIIDSGGSHIIVSNTSIGVFLITFAAAEANWDAIFELSFVKLLGSALIFSLEKRVEATKEALQEALMYAGIADLRDS